jgi:hypothetical protein
LSFDRIPLVAGTSSGPTPPFTAPFNLAEATILVNMKMVLAASAEHSYNIKSTEGALSFDLISFLVCE